MARVLNSLSGRVVLASLLLLPLFLGVSGLYLERSHRLSIEAAEAERLQLQIFTLLAQAEYDSRLQLPNELIETRLGRPGSGLYARVYGRRGDLLWQSPSAEAIGLSRPDDQPPALAPGQRSFRRLGGLFQVAYQVVWETDEGREIPLLFEVLETTAAVDADLALYRRHLLLWLGGAAILLVLCQLAILAWGLKPLRTLARDIAKVEAGVADGLKGRYPVEVQAVTDNLNTLLNSERQRGERARSTLADLAHSLKTPLAVIASADSNAGDYPSLVREQTARMQDIVSYQLQRAVGGTHQLLRAVDVEPLAARLRSSLSKIYADRDTCIELAIPQGTRFRGDQRDLLEMLGNLLDNACKYGRGQVRVHAEQDSRGLQLAVHDNGPGVDAALRQRVLQRGARADSQRQGQGIGLAVVNEIAASYNGTMEITDSPLGGACVRLLFPR